MAQSIAATLAFFAGAVLFMKYGSTGEGSQYALPLMVMGGAWYLVVRFLLWWRGR